MASQKKATSSAVKIAIAKMIGSIAKKDTWDGTKIKLVFVVGTGLWIYDITENSKKIVIGIVLNKIS